MSSSIVAAKTGELRVRVLVPLPRRREAIAADGRRPMVDIVIPVHNEERDLRASVLRLHAYLTQQFPFSARITIADNASTDATPAVAAELAEELPEVRVLRLNDKGRGRALAAAWLTSDARVVSYMDVDLSTDLSALLPLVAPVISGHSQVSIGSRLVTGSRVTRGPKREVISRVYNILLRLVLRVRFKDAQCGFKALRADVARSLLPDVVNRNWFFDTELLIRAERAGLRIHELPVDWTDDPDSRVDIVATAIEDLRGVWRLATGRPTDAPLRLSTQLVRFAAVGAASTLAYAVLFWALREVLPAAASNVIALAATAVANTAANRRLTFGIRGRERLLGDHAGGLLALAAALVFTNGAIVAMGLFAPGASRVAEIAVLTAANAIATGVRFLVLRTVLFHMRAA